MCLTGSCFKCLVPRFCHCFKLWFLAEVELDQQNQVSGYRTLTIADTDTAARPIYAQHLSRDATGRPPAWNYQPPSFLPLENVCLAKAYSSACLGMNYSKKQDDLNPLEDLQVRKTPQQNCVR